MYWHNDWGEEFDSYEEARDKTLEHMEEEDLLDFIFCCRNKDEIIRWAIRQEKFYEEFEDLIHQAEEDFLDEYLSEEEEG